MSNRRESLRVTLLVILLTVVGVTGSSWTGEAAAQDRMILSRSTVSVQESTTVPGGTDMLLAVGSLQLLGIVMFEAMTFARRRRRLTA